MELFLLLSIAMSIVMFISVALPQSPSSSAFSNHNQIELAFQPTVESQFSNEKIQLVNGDNLVPLANEPFPLNKPEGRARESEQSINLTAKKMEPALAI